MPRPRSVSCPIRPGPALDVRSSSPANGAHSLSTGTKRMQSARDGPILAAAVLARTCRIRTTRPPNGTRFPAHKPRGELMRLASGQSAAFASTWKGAKRVVWETPDKRSSAVVLIPPTRKGRVGQRRARCTSIPSPILAQQGRRNLRHPPRHPSSRVRGPSQPSQAHATMPIEDEHYWLAACSADPQSIRFPSRGGIWSNPD